MNTEQLTETFGNRLKQVRIERNISAQELSDKVGIHRSTYSGYETQNRVSPIDTLQKLAIELDTSSDFLLGLSDCSLPKKASLNLHQLLKSNDLHWDEYPLDKEDKETLEKMLSVFVDSLIKKHQQNQNTIDTNTENSFRFSTEKKQRVTNY